MRPFRRTRRASQPLLSLLEGLPTTVVPLGGPPDHSRPYRRASRLLLVLQEGFMTTPSLP